MEHKGEDIIVTDGTTLLGADDKAGIAEIVQAMCYLRDHNDIKHGKIRVGFNPDEEIGMGAHHFGVEKFGCQWAYTMDGGDIGDLEYENFNAAAAKVTIHGVSVHTGYAKGKMINAARIACEFNSMIPVTDIPETTEGYQGFYHLLGIEGACEEAKLSYIIRDHSREKFNDRKKFMEDIAKKLNEKYGDGVVEIKLNDQYYNMKEKIDPNIHVVDLVVKAMEMSGVKPKRRTHTRRYRRCPAVVPRTALPQHLRRWRELPRSLRVRVNPSHGEGHGRHCEHLPAHRQLQRLMSSADAEK